MTKDKSLTMEDLIVGRSFESPLGHKLKIVELLSDHVLIEHEDKTRSVESKDLFTGQNAAMSPLVNVGDIFSHVRPTYETRKYKITGPKYSKHSSMMFKGWEMKNLESDCPAWDTEDHLTHSSIYKKIPHTQVSNVHHVGDQFIDSNQTVFEIVSLMNNGSFCNLKNLTTDKIMTHSHRYVEHESNMRKIKDLYGELEIGDIVRYVGNEGLKSNDGNVFYSEQSRFVVIHTGEHDGLVELSVPEHEDIEKYGIGFWPKNALNKNFKLVSKSSSPKVSDIIDAPGDYVTQNRHLVTIKKEDFHPDESSAKGHVKLSLSQHYDRMTERMYRKNNGTCVNYQCNDGYKLKPTDIVRKAKSSDIFIFSGYNYVVDLEDGSPAYITNIRRTSSFNTIKVDLHKSEHVEFDKILTIPSNKDNTQTGPIGICSSGQLIGKIISESSLTETEIVELTKTKIPANTVQNDEQPNRLKSHEPSDTSQQAWSNWKKIRIPIQTKSAEISEHREISKEIAAIINDPKIRVFKGSGDLGSRYIATDLRIPKKIDDHDKLMSDDGAYHTLNELSYDDIAKIDHNELHIAHTFIRHSDVSKRLDGFQKRLDKSKSKITKRIRPLV